MKQTLYKLLSLFVIVVIAAFIVGSCRKNAGLTDLSSVQPNVPGVRQLTVSALNSSTNDTITGFKVNIQTPSGLIEEWVTGKKYVMNNPVSGTYTIAASLDGFLSSPKTVKVLLPTDATTDLLINESISVTRMAPAVALNAKNGGTVPVQSNSEVIASPVIANVSVPSQTVFTMPDGSKPASVNISATNIPVAPLPMLKADGLKELDLDGVELIQDKLPVVTLDLQPSGLTFDQPMTIEMFIGDLYPLTMPVAEKNARSENLTFNYVRQDGLIEKVLPDHFSTDRNRAYYKISHFSKWSLLGEKISFKPISTSFSPEEIQTGGCGQPLSGFFKYQVRYKADDPKDPYLPWLLTNKLADAVYNISEHFSYPAIPGYSIKVSWRCKLENWQLTDDNPGGSTRMVVIPQSGNEIKYEYIPCHNQGGGE